jgi:hypothetical protein
VSLVRRRGDTERRVDHALASSARGGHHNASYSTRQRRGIAALAATSERGHTKASLVVAKLHTGAGFMSLPSRLLAAIPLAALSACAADAGGGGDLQIAPLYDHTSGHLLLQLDRPLDGNERILARVRRGSFGALDCAADAGALTAVTDSGKTLLTGPAVDPALTRQFYGPEWASEPTPEMLAQLALGTDSVIDVCLFDGDTVVQRIEADLFQTWDRSARRDTTGTIRKDEPETRINSAQEYGVRCVGELGEIPFFQPTATAGEYSTFNCLDATPVPMTVTAADGTVTSPDRSVSKCDKPQYIYSSCEGGPRVATKINDQGTRWTLLCRKSIGGATSSQYNDIAMIGHNPFTGKTCFFQNALYQKKDGANIPHPADRTKSVNLWSGVHGGLGSGIQCADCHDADAFIHTPWIDGAKDAAGRPVVPKMGFDPDLPVGANDAPYSIVNLAGQGWTMHKQIVSPEVNACLQCHRMGAGKWLPWAKRLDGTDTTFRNLTTPAYRTFEKIHWMPPDLAGLDASTWATSEVGKALAFLKRCATDRTLCQLADIPTTGTGGGSGAALRNPVDLPDDQLATQAAALIGVGVPGAQSRCGDCHSINRHGLRDWQLRSLEAEEGCLRSHGPGASHTEQIAAQAVVKDQFVVFGPFEVAVGGSFEARMSGDGDADLYVKKGSPVTIDSYDCRPYGGDSNETCGQPQVPGGAGQYWVAINGYAPTSTVGLDITYTITAGEARPASEMVACLRMDPDRADSPFTPYKLGIYSAAADLGWFRNLFQAAYPVTGSTPWQTEYLKFRQRVAMPKGNHPKLTQAEFDVVAEWMARGLPNLEVVVPADPAPDTCTPSISGDLVAHATAMQTQGWGAINAERGMRMFGCTDADPQHCLSTLPTAESKPYGAGWASLPGSQLRVLRELSFNTSYWMRSSADGRFIANGATGGTGAMTSDLQADRDIPTHAAYDPGFFPDNSGFVFQGTPISTGFCEYDLLTSGPAEITFGEPQCSAAAQIGLYQHLGAGLDGGDYFLINGQFTSDNGGFSSTLEDPVAGFTSDTQVTLTPMTHTGSHYEPKSAVALSMPFEGDSILSPSTRLMVNRLGNPDLQQQLGFVVRRVDATPSGSSYAITAPEVARYCVRGGKPAVSFDERFLTYHHYVEAGDWAELGFASADDPGFVEYRTKGAANIYVLDMVTGVTRRVTHLGTGQYALFPHFRSDGWIYFLVRDSNTGKEYAMASDAKLVLD